MAQKFEYTVLDMIESATRTILTKPVNLGGVGGTGGGVGGPPGGFVGRLAQFNVAYDTLEAATLSTLPSGVTGASGWSLVDNLNHIRYRIDNIVAGSGIITVDEADGSPSVSPTNRITFSGAIVTDLGGGHALVTISGGGGGLDTAAGDARYLKLDTSNDPLTAQLNVVPSNPGDGGIYIESHGDSYTLDAEQISNSATNVTSPALFVLQSIQSTGSHLFNSHLIYGYRHRTGPSTGIYDSDYIRMEHSVSGVQFNVDKDGHAYDNGDLLITEAPIDGIVYGRQDGDWVPASGGGGYTQEQIEDFVGGMISGNTENGVDASYDDTLGKLNFNLISYQYTDAPTTANTSISPTAYSQNLLSIDLSGLTASRILTLNSGSLGTVIRVVVSASAPAGYSLTIQPKAAGPGSCTLHGSTSAWQHVLTESKQAVTFVATSTGNWEVVSTTEVEKHLTILDYDGVPTIVDVDKITFSGATITDQGNGDVLVAFSGGSGSSSLTVMDADTTPTVTNVDTIIFSGFLVENLGSGDVRVTISGFGASETYINQTPDNGTYGLLSGSVNSSNAIFTVSAGSYISGSLSVFLNGQYQTQGSSNDWTETSPSAGTFTFVTAPTTGDIVTATYSKVNTSFGNADTVDGLHASAFALAANGVTNGDSHDHNGGDGAQINHTTLSNIGTFTHAQLDDIDNTGWIPRTETWTRTGNHTFTVTGNLTTTFRKGTKVRYKDGGSYEYGVVASSAFSSVTTVTLITNSDYAMAAVTITDTYISYIENPDAFPQWFNYAMTIGGFTGTPSQISKFSVKGKTCEVYLYVEGTSNATTFTTTAPVAQVGGFTAFYQPARAINNSAATPLTPAAVLTNGGTTITFYIDWNANVWTNSGAKGIALSFAYEF